MGTRREKGTVPLPRRACVCAQPRVRFCPPPARLSSKASGDFQIDNSACISIFLKHGLKSSLPTPRVSLEDCGHARRRGRKAGEKRREKEARKDEEESKGQMQGRPAAGRGESGEETPAAALWSERLRCFLGSCDPALQRALSDPPSRPPAVRRKVLHLRTSLASLTGAAWEKGSSQGPRVRGSRLLLFGCLLSPGALRGAARSSVQPPLTAEQS